MDRLSAYPLRIAVFAVATAWLSVVGCVSSNGTGSTDATVNSSNPAESDPIPPAAGTAEITDAQLDAFARISQKIHRVKVKTEKRLQKADTEKESEQVRKWAYQEIREIFRKADISEQLYQEIGRRLKTDRRLRERLKERLEEQN